MKRKKKKKVNSLHSKQSRQASFNHFYKQIHHYLKLIECEELAPLFDKESCSLLYQLKNTILPKIRTAPGVSIRRTTKNHLSDVLDYVISNQAIEFSNNSIVSIKEILLYFALIDVNIQYKGSKSYDLNTNRLAQKYKEKIPDFEVLHDTAVNHVLLIALIQGLILSNMNASICWFKYLQKPEGNEDKRFVLELNEFIPKKQTMIIDGHPRPVYPVCHAFDNDGPKEISIPAWRIRLSKETNQPHDASNIPVYFQNHLLHRLDERLDCIPRYMSQYWFYSSLEKPKFIYFKGKRLVEYVAGEKIKLGYIVLEFHKDRLLAKTFLLLTNSGTPEGEKLKEISGMKKCDLQYWAIDKMSTFQTSDLKDHPKTKLLFEHAGCGNLFEDLSSPEMISGISSSPQAAQMLRYIEGAGDNREMLMAV